MTSGSKPFATGRCAPATGRRCFTTGSDLSSCAIIVDSYIKDWRPFKKAEMAFYARASVDIAVLSQRENGRRHPHQYRIPLSSLQAALSRLKGRRFDGTGNFDSLHREIKDAIGDIPKIGPLAIYDIAQRIGVTQNIWPARIYLHAGTRGGAQTFGLSGDSISVDNLPPEFGELTPAECEDCLCIYASALKQIAALRAAG